MKIIQKIKNTSYIVDLLFYGFAFFFILAGILVSVHRFWQYEVFFYDFGIFDQAIWNVSRFKPPIIDHLAVGGKWIFADHFSPSIFLFSPLYWLTDRSEVLLIIQSLMVGLTGIVIYHLGKFLVKNKLLAFSSALSFYLFIGVQNAVISDFHEVTVSILPLVLTFWFILKKRVWSYFISLIILLGFKESIFFLGIGIGILILIIKWEWFKIGLATIFLSLVWGFLSIKIIIPYFSGGIYQYSASFPSGIYLLITSFFDSPIKLKTLFYSFFSFGFLPIISPAFWFLFLQDFTIRFYPEWPTRWGLGLHYSAQIGVLLAVSSLYSFYFLKKNRIFKKFFNLIGFFMILNSLILYRFVLHGPLALSYHPEFYRNTSNFKFLDLLIKKIPEDAEIVTQNNLATRFSHQNVKLLRENYKNYNPDYILFDNRKGQNPNNFFGIKNSPVLFKILLEDKNYSVVFKTKEQFILKRI